MTKYCGISPFSVRYRKNNEKTNPINKKSIIYVYTSYDNTGLVALHKKWSFPL